MRGKLRIVLMITGLGLMSPLSWAMDSDDDRDPADVFEDMAINTPKLPTLTRQVSNSGKAPPPLDLTAKPQDASKKLSSDSSSATSGTASGPVRRHSVISILTDTKGKKSS